MWHSQLPNANPKPPLFAIVPSTIAAIGRPPARNSNLLEICSVGLEHDGFSKFNKDLVVQEQEVFHEGGYITNMGPRATDDGVITA